MSDGDPLLMEVDAAVPHNRSASVVKRRSLIFTLPCHFCQWLFCMVSVLKASLCLIYPRFLDVCVDVVACEFSCLNFLIHLLQKQYSFEGWWVSRE